MEVRRGKESFPLLPPGYVTLNDLRDRWLKNQEIQRRDKQAAEGNEGGSEMRREEAVAEEGGNGGRREKVAVEKVHWKADEGGNRGRRERDEVEEVGWNRTRNAEEGERVAVEGLRRSWNERADEGGSRRRREKEMAEGLRRSWTDEKEEGGSERRRENVAVGEVCWNRTRNSEEGESGKRREKAAVVEVQLIVTDDKEEGENWRMREKAVVEGGGGGLTTEEGGNWERREKGERTNGKKKKYRKNKGKAKAVETLGEVAGNEKVPEGTVVDPTVVVNGKVWVKKVTPSVEVDPMAGIERKFGDFSLRERNGGGGRRENRMDETGRKIEYDRKSDRKTGGDPTVEIKQSGEGGDAMDVKKSVHVDPTAEIGLKIGGSFNSEKKQRGEARDVKENVEGDRTVEIKQRGGDRKGGNAGRNGSGVRFRGFGKNVGHKAMDSSLVWVRKEDKSEVCVAGNCGEGVLEKAGESEKKPGRGRP